MKRVARAFFFRTGVNDLVRAEIDRHQQRHKDTRARLEQQVHELQKSTDTLNKELRQLNRRYTDLTEKYNAAMELLDRRHEQLGRVVDDVHQLKKERLSGRLTTLERARQDDQAERLRVLTAELQERIPVPSLVSHLERVIEQSPLEQEPYPHVVLNDVLPDALHNLLYDARPPEGFWRDGQAGRQNWTVGEDLGPLRTEAAWRFMDDVVASRVMTPVLAGVFEDYLQTQMSARTAKAGKARLAYERSGGRLMLDVPVTPSSRISIRGAHCSPRCSISAVPRTVTITERNCSDRTRRSRKSMRACTIRSAKERRAISRRPCRPARTRCWCLPAGSGSTALTSLRTRSPPRSSATHTSSISARHRSRDVHRTPI
jgi:hypothetical protein